MSLIKAENIKIGDYIYIYKQGEKKVNKIEYTMSQPRLIITKSGNIIVNNVISSNFASYHFIQYYYYLFLYYFCNFHNVYFIFFICSIIGLYKI
jgi:hypothetical protein